MSTKNSIKTQEASVVVTSPSSISLWRISGEASNDSGGGEYELLVLSDNPIVPPNPHVALEQSNPRYGWYRIDSIANLGTTADGGVGSKIIDGMIDRIVNMSGLTIDPFVVDVLASLILEVERLEEMVASIQHVRRSDATIMTPGVYRGVRLSIGDGHSSEMRLMKFIDTMSNDDRKALMFAHLHQGCLSLIWQGIVPSAYEVAECVDSGDGDSWSVSRSTGTHKLI